jgi:AhpD family alkylhydroperoxidase
MDYREHYKHVTDLMGKLGNEAPQAMAAFSRLHQATVGQGALSAKVKELIALAIGINVRCDGCVAYHVHDAVEAGATREEALETIGVAIMMGGGPSVIYGSQALEALDQFMPAS